MHDEKRRLGEKMESSDNSSLTQCPIQSQSSNYDRVLFNDLLQIVPLVHSLVDDKARGSFTRWSSIIYTKKPSREWLSKRSRITEEEEFVSLKEKEEELQKKLLEKDKLLQSAEKSRNQMKALNEKLDELKIQASEKDSLLKSTQQRLLDVKIKLADKQAALEKIPWQTMTSNQKAEKLQEEIDSMQGDISSVTMLIEGLTKTDINVEYTDDYDVKPYHFNHIHGIDDVDEMEMQKMEEATKAYKVVVAATKKKLNEDSIASATNARLHLQSILFKDLNFQCIIFLALFQVLTRLSL